jgi:hypothetical protein
MHTLFFILKIITAGLIALWLCEAAVFLAILTKGLSRQADDSRT